MTEIILNSIIFVTVITASVPANFFSFFFSFHFFSFISVQFYRNESRALCKRKSNLQGGFWGLEQNFMTVLLVDIYGPSFSKNG